MLTPIASFLVGWVLIRHVCRAAMTGTLTGRVITDLASGLAFQAPDGERVSLGGDTDGCVVAVGGSFAK